MTARHWVKMLQSEAVSLKKFVMGEPEGNEGYCRERLSFVSMLSEARWPHR